MKKGTPNFKSTGGNYRVGVTRIEPARNDYEALQELIHAETGVNCTVRVGVSQVSIKIPDGPQSFSDWLLAKRCIKHRVGSKEVVRSVL